MVFKESPDSAAVQIFSINNSAALCLACILDFADPNAVKNENMSGKL